MSNAVFNSSFTRFEKTTSKKSGKKREEFKVRGDEIVKKVKSLIKEGLEGHINLVNDWSLGKMSEEDTENSVQEHLREVEEHMTSIKNFVNNFPQSLPRDTIKRLIFAKNQAETPTNKGGEVTIIKSTFF